VAAAETLQARRAALLLHGLSSQQRRLVMAKLGAAETSRLEPMLDELSRIGIPGELAVGSEILAGPPERTPNTLSKESVPREHTAVQRAAQLDVESVLRALETSAPSTLGHLLRSYDWPWKEEVLERLPEPRRSRAFATGQAQLRPLAPAALTFLCTRLCSEAERATTLPRLDPGLRVSLPSQVNRWSGNRWRSDPWRNGDSGIRARFKRWIGWGR